MHSSRMRTRGCTCQGGSVPAWSRGVYLPGGVYLLGGVYLVQGGGCLVQKGGVWSRGCTCLLWGGVYLPGPGGRGRGVPGQVLLPPVDSMTHFVSAGKYTDGIPHKTSATCAPEILEPSLWSNSMKLSNSFLTDKTGKKEN